MKRNLTMMILIMVFLSLSAVAVDWEELEWSATVVSDYRTGQPAIVFSTGLAYDEQPETMQIHIAWEVFRVDGGSETMLYEFSRTATVSRLANYFSSEAVPIEPGGLYVARVRIDDDENALSYRRAFSHIEPYSLPVGLRFVGWDGTQEADLAAMSDEGINELVLLRRAINSYEIVATNVSIGTLFSQYAAANAAYPVSVILLPETGVDNNWGSESKPITVTFGLTVLTFSIPSSNVQSGFQEQLSQYDQTFSGTVYAGPGSGGPSEGAIIFVHDAMAVILNEAVAELAARDN
ncbi:hypothetical protein KKG90_10090 [Candidatus Bipolaricaulota bacterium]|nr:hypothetical protein [Candidatus Bipolaricaulota bacterium]